MAPTAVQPVDTELAPVLGLRIILRRAFSFPVLLGVFLVAAALIVARFNWTDPDMWSHAATGREILATRTFPTTDAYSFTASGNPSMAFEWLGQGKGSLPHTEHACDRVLSMPLFPEMTRDQAEYAAATLRAVADSVGR